MGVRFRGWGIALPDQIVTNDELSRRSTPRRVDRRTHRIRERRIGGSAVSLGVIAGETPSKTPDCSSVTSTSW